MQDNIENNTINSLVPLGSNGLVRLGNSIAIIEKILSERDLQLSNPIDWWNSLNSIWKVILYNSYKYKNYDHIISLLENPTQIPELSKDEIENILKIEKVFYNNDPADGYYENDYERLTNVIGIKPLTKLKYLDLGWNNLTENNFNFYNPSLLEFSGEHNKISNLNFLNNFPNLESIKLDYNNITEISDLKLGVIKHINLGCNKITNVENIQNLKTLEEVNLYNNDIEDLNGIEALVNIRSLSIFGNKISDLSPLSNLTRIQKLVLDNNKIKDLSPLCNLTELRNLSITSNTYSNYQNTVTSLRDLYKLNNLEKLYIYGNPISKNEREYLNKMIPNCNIYYEFG